MANNPVCGSSGCGLFGHVDPFACSLKTYLLSELAGLTPCSLRWLHLTTTALRSWWVLRPSARRTDETGCGSSPAWTTPQNHDAHGTPDATRHGRYGTKHRGRNLPDHVAIFPTPTSHDAERGAENKATKAKRNAGGVNLREACNRSTPRNEDSEQTGAYETPDTLTSACRWSTPIASDSLGEMHQSAAATEKGWQPRLQDQLRQWQTPTKEQFSSRKQVGNTKRELLLAGQCRQDQSSTNGKRRGSLNLAWVSQLMGYPNGWLDLPAETLCRLSATP